MRAVALLVLVVIILIFLLPKGSDPLPVEMRASPIHGRGMFATRNIKRDDVIERAPLVVIDRNEDLTNGSLLRKYDIAYKDGKHAVMLGYASIYNHSDDNNVIWDFEPNEDIIYIKAIRDIQPDEEVCVTYGPRYWGASRMQEKK